MFMLSGWRQAIRGHGIWVGAVGAIAVAACVVFSRCGLVESKPPNILIITVDALRADHLDAYGYERDTAPELTALAARGARFDAAYAQAPLTVPSLLMIMTGELFYHGNIPAGIPTLAERLKAEGYTTAAFVRNPLLEIDLRGTNRGFDTFFTPDRVSDEDTTGEKLHPVAERQLYAADLKAEEVLARADEWLRANHEREPFFLWVHLFDPHDPYSPPPPHDKQFDAGYKGNADGDIRRTKNTDHPIWEFVEQNPSPEDHRHIIALYDGEVRHASSEIGKFLDKWAHERTLIVFSADHGESLGEHRIWGHGYSLYETELRIPLFMVLQGKIPAGTVISQPVESIDIVPTVLSLAGIEPDKRLTGKDLTPLFSGGNINEAGVFARWAGESSYRSGNWKVMLGKKRGFELYDLEKDPGEQRNLASEKPEKLKRMRRALEVSGRREIRINEKGEPLRDRLKGLGYL